MKRNWLVNDRHIYKEGNACVNGHYFESHQPGDSKWYYSKPHTRYYNSECLAYGVAAYGVVAWTRRRC